MCGIAGLIRLSGRAPIPPGILKRMAAALAHRGPDDEGYWERDGVGFANTRLSIVGVDDGRQPARNEDGTVAVVFNGEIFEYPELRDQLGQRGHRFATHSDADVIPHLWEEHESGVFEHLRGQFAFALHDTRRQQVILARDRFGILPLYWTRQASRDGEWLLFASEIKALLASGFLEPAPDVRGIDQVFHFFAVPGPATCFAGVQALQPGQYLQIDLRGEPTITRRVYWSPDFPDRGHERDGDTASITAEFESAFESAVRLRLRADVPVVSYLSGGVDSSFVAAMAAKVRGAPTPVFTVQVDSRGYDESHEAAIVARHIGATPTIVRVDPRAVVAAYPELIAAAEAPVIDTAAATILPLARAVHRAGFKVALAGEGSDEWLAGYPWHKVHRLVSVASVVPGADFAPGVRRLMCRAAGVPEAGIRRILDVNTVLGHHSAFHYVYGLMTGARHLFFGADMLQQLGDHNPYLELEPDLARMKRWHWINQGAYWAARIHLPGHLLSLKGDRPAMHSSVEARYPFLDERLFALVASLHPRWKMRGFRDKYLLRKVAERYLPREIAWRKKVMFRAPLDSFFSPSQGGPPAFIGQLLSDDALRQTGWFDVRQVQHWRTRLAAGSVPRLQRAMVEMGLVGVVTSQLWYHTFIEHLANLPDWRRSLPAA